MKIYLNCPYLLSPNFHCVYRVKHNCILIHLIPWVSCIHFAHVNWNFPFSEMGTNLWCNMEHWISNEINIAKKYFLQSAIYISKPILWTIESWQQTNWLLNLCRLHFFLTLGKFLFLKILQYRCFFFSGQWLTLYPGMRIIHISPYK